MRVYINDIAATQVITYIDFSKNQFKSSIVKSEKNF